MPFQMQTGVCDQPSTSAPFSAVGDVTEPSTKTRLEDVDLEAGSSYSDVCVTDRHAVSNAKLGFVTTPSTSHHSPPSRRHRGLYEEPTRRCRLETGSIIAMSASQIACRFNANWGCDHARMSAPFSASASCFRSKVISTCGFHFRSWPTFAFRMLADVGQCRQCHIRVGHGRKCGVAVGFASIAVSVEKLFHFRFSLPVLCRHLRFGCC